MKDDLFRHRNIWTPKPKKKGYAGLYASIMVLCGVASGVVLTLGTETWICIPAILVWFVAAYLFAKTQGE